MYIFLRHNGGSNLEIKSDIKVIFENTDWF